jgi:hypothetical protein
MLGLSCSRREVTTKPEAAAAILYDDDQMRTLIALTARLELGMRKAEVFALLGPPTRDQTEASKESNADHTGPRHVYGSSVGYVGRDGRTLPRVPRSADRVMTGEPTIGLRFDPDGGLVSIHGNIEGVAQRDVREDAGDGDR